MALEQEHGVHSGMRSGATPGGADTRMPAVAGDTESAGTTPSRAVSVLSRVMARTSRTPLRFAWALAYWGLVRILTITLRWGHPERSVYLAGGFGRAEVLYGISDLDLVTLTPTRPGARGSERETAGARMRRTLSRLRLPDDVVHFAAMEDEAVGAAARATTYTYGLDRDPRPALYHGPDALWLSGTRLLHGPGLSGPGGDWRRVAGPERRPPTGAIARNRRPLIAWLTMQSLWRFAFSACLWPGPRAPYLCVKLVAEALRAIDWLEGGALIRGRVGPLLRFSEEDSPRGEAARRALELYELLPRSPEPPLQQALADFASLCDELGSAIDGIAFERGSQQVALRRGELALANRSEGSLLPLADWRSLCYWFPPDEALLLIDGDPSRPEDIRGAAGRDDGQRCPTLRHGDLLVQPTREIHRRGLLRAAQCRASDPISFALLAGAQEATFPLMPGWSIEDWARRATAEHSAWLGDRARHLRDEPGFTLAKLFGAARAALLRESVHRGSPELPLTVSAIAEVLAEARPEAGAQIDEALARYRAWRVAGEPVLRGDNAAIAAAVRSLPAYDGSRPLRVSSAPGR
jgi:hypothetical protein